jgi:tetratricopeptide (TPR) repeat protein
MDPARSEKPASEALTGAERDARIEQLLLTGLDHYFAAEYEEAINLWTRVLFLDRHHDRARAYIERARSAQAERQRESEALMHEGLEAFKAGDVETARRLMADALAQGASRDLALGVLDRIERLDVPAAETRGHDGLRRPRRADRPEDNVPTQAEPPRSGRVSATHILLVFAALGAAAVALWGVTLPDVNAWIFARQAAPSTPAFLPVVEMVPLPTASELYLSRGRTLFQSGRLRDALRELDRVPVGDTGRAEADRLRARIQRDLLATTAPSRPANEVP